MRVKNKGIDYDRTLPGPGKWLLFLLEGIGIAAAIDELFYREAAAMIPLSAFTVLWMRHQKNEWRRKKKERLILDFREALNALSISLRAGISVENALPEVWEALKRTLGDKSDMTREFRQMTFELRIGIPAETLFTDLAQRSGSEEIQDFAMIFSFAKRMGGNLSGLIRKTADQIGARIETEEEIQTNLSAKKMEQRIMALMPFGILAYLQLTSLDYLSVLYHSVAGAAFMTVCLVFWMAAAVWGNSIVRISL